VTTNLATTRTVIYVESYIKLYCRTTLYAEKGSRGSLRAQTVAIASEVQILERAWCSGAEMAPVEPPSERSHLYLPGQTRKGVTDPMRMRTGQLWECRNGACGCEILVVARSAAKSGVNPRCSCGSLMNAHTHGRSAGPVSPGPRISRLGIDGKSRQASSVANGFVLPK